MTITINTDLLSTVVGALATGLLALNADWPRILAGDRQARYEAYAAAIPLIVGYFYKRKDPGAQPHPDVLALATKIQEAIIAQGGIQGKQDGSK